jgi:two-component system NarL family response regulator
MQTTNLKLKVVIVDDHFLFPLALKGIIENYDFLEMQAIIKNGKELLDRLDELKPDVIFMDILMPLVDGFTATSQVIAKYPATKIVAITALVEGEYVKKIMDAGAWGFITKGSEKKEFDALFEHLRVNKKFISSQAALSYQDFVNGSHKEKDTKKPLPKPTVTKRELQVIVQISKGLSDKEIAKILRVSHRTIDAHKQNLMNKFGTRKSAEIVAIAYKLKLI